MFILVPPCAGPAAPQSAPSPILRALHQGLPWYPARASAQPRQLRTPLGETPAPHQCFQTRFWGPVPHPAWGTMLQT